jgi:hypothetical protein
LLCSKTSWTAWRIFPHDGRAADSLLTEGLPPEVLTREQSIRLNPAACAVDTDGAMYAARKAIAFAASMRTA